MRHILYYTCQKLHTHILVLRLPLAPREILLGLTLKLARNRIVPRSSALLQIKSTHQTVALEPLQSKIVNAIALKISLR